MRVRWDGHVTRMVFVGDLKEMYQLDELIVAGRILLKCVLWT